MRGAIALFARAVAMHHTAELDSWLTAMDDWSDEWSSSFDLSDFSLRLTPARARALGAELHAVLESYRDPAAEDPGAESVRVHLHLFPRPAD